MERARANAHVAATSNHPFPAQVPDNQKPHVPRESILAVGLLGGIITGFIGIGIEKMLYMLLTMHPRRVEVDTTQAGVSCITVAGRVSNHVFDPTSTRAYATVSTRLDFRGELDESHRFVQKSADVTELEGFEVWSGPQRSISAQVVGLVSAIAATYYFIVGLVPVCLWLVSLPGTWLGSLFGARLADSFGSRNVLIFFVAFLCLEVVYNVCVLTELPIFDSISSLNR